MSTTRWWFRSADNEDIHMWSSRLRFAAVFNFTDYSVMGVIYDDVNVLPAAVI